MQNAFEYTYPNNRSLLATLTINLIGLMGVKTNDDKKIKTVIQSNSQPAKVPNRLKEKYQVTETILEGRKLWTISRKDKEPTSVLLYLHGGAYTVNIIKPHWMMLEKIMDQTNISIMIPDYPLTNQSNWKDVYTYMKQLMPAFHQFRGGKPWTISGDSAGGGLSLAYTQYLKNQQQELPNAVILLSPCGDVSTDNPLQKEIEKHDKMLSIKSTRMYGESYTDGLSSKDYRVSPLFGDLENLPPIHIFTGTYDIVNADAHVLLEKLQSLNAPYGFYEYPRLFHVFMALPFLKEARVAIGQISGIINDLK